MVDTFRPLLMTRQAAGIEDPDYYLSWLAIVGVIVTLLILSLVLFIRAENARQTANKNAAAAREARDSAEQSSRAKDELLATLQADKAELNKKEEDCFFPLSCTRTNEDNYSFNLL